MSSGVLYEVFMRAHENFIRRHLGPSDQDVASMLRVVGAEV